MGIDAAVFFSSGGGIGATVEAARGQPAATPCAPDVGVGGGRRWPVGPCGWTGPAGRPRPSGGGQGKSAGKKKRLGRKAGWAESVGENSFPNKICTRRFRRNFDMRIIPKFFYAPQGF
jgi:hypothetical protein